MIELHTITGFMQTNPPVVVGYPENGGLVVEFPGNLVIEVPSPDQVDSSKNITISFPGGFTVEFPGDTGLEVDFPGSDPFVLPESADGSLLIDLPVGGSIVVEIPFKQPIPGQALPKIEVGAADLRVMQIRRAA